MSKEFLLEFRADFNAGPVKIPQGTKLWTTVGSMVVDQGGAFRECYRICLNPEDHPMAGGDIEGWRGGVIVPCSFVRFSEEEYDLRAARG